MQLTTHSDAGHLNQSKAKAHVSLSEDVPMLTSNRAVLKIVQIIKYLMSSAAEGELASFLITSRKCVALRQPLNEMRWPQKPAPTQVNNATAVGVFTDKIIPKKIRAWM